MAKTSNVSSVKTPGEAAPLPAPADNDEAALDAQVSDTSGVELPKVAKPDLTDPAQLQAFIQSQVEAGIAAGLKAAKRASLQPNAAATAAPLPDQADIDPNTIEREVLTKQGYVVPSRLGETPAHLKNLDR